MPPTRLFLGKKPKRTDPRTLQFSKYLTGSLTPPPVSVRWDEAVHDYNADGNLEYGDCVEAAKAHIVQTNTANAGSEVDTPSAQVVKDYFTETGGQDTGLVILDSMNYWRKNGLITDVSADPVDKLGAYGEVAVTDQAAMRYGIYYCGSAIIGVVLPDYILSEPPGTTWDVMPGNPPPNPNNGHCVPLLGYDETYFYCLTWGEVTAVTPAFLSQYMDEAYIPLDSDFIDASTGKAPNGFDLAQLQADLSAIVSGPTPNPPAPTGCAAMLQTAEDRFAHGQILRGIEALFEYIDCIVTGGSGASPEEHRALLERIRRKL